MTGTMKSATLSIIFLIAELTPQFSQAKQRHVHRQNPKKNMILMMWEWIKNNKWPAITSCLLFQTLCCIWCKLRNCLNYLIRWNITTKNGQKSCWAFACIVSSEVSSMRFACPDQSSLVIPPLNFFQPHYKAILIT